MIAAVWLGCKEGVRYKTCQHGQALYGQLVSEHFRGVAVLELWPLDFALNARQSQHNVKPLARLWRPAYSGVFEIAMAYTGLECTGGRGARRWFLQRWYIEPKTRRDVEISKAYDRGDRAEVQRLVREQDDEELQRQAGRVTSWALGAILDATDSPTPASEPTFVSKRLLDASSCVVDSSTLPLSPDVRRV